MKKLHEFRKPLVNRFLRSTGTKIRILRRECHELQTLSRVLALRKASKPRCLKCGSTDVFPIDLPYPKEEAEIRVGFQHPMCGGYLYANNPATHCVVSLSEMIYDVEGNLLTEIRAS